MLAIFEAQKRERGGSVRAYLVKKKLYKDYIYIIHARAC